MTTRRFPASWSIRELEQALVVVDANGQACGRLHLPLPHENEAQQGSVLTRDEARRIAANIAKLPNLLSRKGQD